MKPWFFAAGIETLITLLIFVGLSVLSSWLKNRNAAQGADDLPPPPQIPRRDQPPRPSRPTREQKPSSWEEELRRLLEGESPAAPTPPPIRVEHRAPAPPPLPPVTQPPPRFTGSRRVVAVDEESAEGGGLAVNLPMPPQAGSVGTHASHAHAQVGERVRQSGVFTAANASIDRASHLHELTTARMRHISEDTREMTAVKNRVRLGAEGIRAAAVLRNPATIRTAIVASIILGPPKAMES